MTNSNQKTIVDAVADVTKPLDRAVEKVEKTVDEALEPVRKSALKRYPTLFGLFVVFGASAVLYAMEDIISGIPYLSDNPFFLLLIGVVILFGTGRLYKKLS